MPGLTVTAGQADDRRFRRRTTVPVVHFTSSKIGQSLLEFGVGGHKLLPDRQCLPERLQRLRLRPDLLRQLGELEAPRRQRLPRLRVGLPGQQLLPVGKEPGRLL
jgi:hypothetical protein